MNWKKTIFSALSAALSGSAVLFANSDGALNKQNASLIASGALVGLVNYFIKSPIATAPTKAEEKIENKSNG